MNGRFSNLHHVCVVVDDLDTANSGAGVVLQIGASGGAGIPR